MDRKQLIKTAIAAVVLISLSWLFAGQVEETPRGGWMAAAAVYTALGGVFATFLALVGFIAGGRTDG